MFCTLKKLVKKKRHLYKKKLEEKKNIQFKKKIKECGENLMLFGNVDIASPEKLIIRNSCRMNDQVYINARSGVEIGNDVTISYGAKIISTGYDIEHWLQTNEKIHDESTPIYIGNHCWIGAGAMILPGVQITGEYVVIAAGAVVTKNITESKVIVAGVPAKIVKKLGEID